MYSFGTQKLTERNLAKLAAQYDAGLVSEHLKALEQDRTLAEQFRNGWLNILAKVPDASGRLQSVQLRVLMGGSLPWQRVNAIIHHTTLHAHTDKDLFGIPVNVPCNSIIKPHREALKTACMSQYQLRENSIFSSDDGNVMSFVVDENDYNLISQVEVLCNFQVFVNENGDIEYSPDIPTHEEDFNKFIFEHKIICYKLEELLSASRVYASRVAEAKSKGLYTEEFKKAMEKTPEFLNFKKLTFVLKSFLKPFSVGKTFDLGTAFTLANELKDGANDELKKLIAERMSGHYGHLFTDTNAAETHLNNIILKSNEAMSAAKPSDWQAMMARKYAEQQAQLEAQYREQGPKLQRELQATQQALDTANEQLKSAREVNATNTTVIKELRAKISKSLVDSVNNTLGKKEKEASREEFEIHLSRVYLDKYLPVEEENKNLKIENEALHEKIDVLQKEKQAEQEKHEHQLNTLKEQHMSEKTKLEAESSNTIREANKSILNKLESVQEENKMLLNIQKEKQTLIDRLTSDKNKYEKTNKEISKDNNELKNTVIKQGEQIKDLQSKNQSLTQRVANQDDLKKEREGFNKIKKESLESIRSFEKYKKDSEEKIMQLNKVVTKLKPDSLAKDHPIINPKEIEKTFKKSSIELKAMKSVNQHEDVAYETWKNHAVIFIHLINQESGSSKNPLIEMFSSLKKTDIFNNMSNEDLIRFHFKAFKRLSTEMKNLDDNHPLLTNLCQLFDSKNILSARNFTEGAFNHIIIMSTQVFIHSNVLWLVGNEKYKVEFLKLIMMEYALFLGNSHPKKPFIDRIIEKLVPLYDEQSNKIQSLINDSKRVDNAVIALADDNMVEDTKKYINEWNSIFIRNTYERNSYHEMFKRIKNNLKMSSTDVLFNYFLAIKLLPGKVSQDSPFYKNLSPLIDDAFINELQSNKNEKEKLKSIIQAKLNEARHYLINVNTLSYDAADLEANPETVKSIFSMLVNVYFRSFFKPKDRMDDVKDELLDQIEKFEHKSPTPPVVKFSSQLRYKNSNTTDRSVIFLETILKNFYGFIPKDQIGNKNIEIDNTSDEFINIANRLFSNISSVEYNHYVVNYTFYFKKLNDININDLNLPQTFRIAAEFGSKRYMPPFPKPESEISTRKFIEMFSREFSKFTWLISSDVVDTLLGVNLDHIRRKIEIINNNLLKKGMDHLYDSSDRLYFLYRRIHQDYGYDLKNLHSIPDDLQDFSSDNNGNLCFENVSYSEHEIYAAFLSFKIRLDNKDATVISYDFIKTFHGNIAKALMKKNFTHEYIQREGVDKQVFLDFFNSWINIFVKVKTITELDQAFESIHAVLPKNMDKDQLPLYYYESISFAMNQGLIGIKSHEILVTGLTPLFEKRFLEKVIKNRMVDHKFVREEIDNAKINFRNRNFFKCNDRLISGDHFVALMLNHMVSRYIYFSTGNTQLVLKLTAIQDVLHRWADETKSTLSQEDVLKKLKL